MVAGGVDAASPAAFLIIGALVLAAMFAIGIIFGTLGTIFNTGTYIYATTGKAPSIFDQSMMQQAFQPKKKR